MTFETRQDDLIVARATPPGVAAVAIVRFDGGGVDRLLEALFFPEAKHPPIHAPRRMVYGTFRDASGEVIDRGLAVFFRAPASYTGNDLAEFHLHGGAEPVQQIIAASTALGARPAEPGEFTRRAYLNGKMDLARAEAVADVINAQTAAAARLAQRQLAGTLSTRILAIRESLINLGAELEARIDFPEEDLAAADETRLAAAFTHGLQEIETLLATGRRGRLLREGARIALVGRPNAGKSSLLNALARTERAIVTPHPGTTRDTIECLLDIGGFPVTLIDTAGLRPSNDPVEQLGIARARAEIEAADLVLLIRDATEPAKADEQTLIPRPPDLVILNKSDLCPATSSSTTIALSARTGDGLDLLEAKLIALLRGGSAEEGELAVNARHTELLTRARTSLAAATATFQSHGASELVMIDLRETLTALGEILGLELGDAILDRVFSAFCIGK